MDAQQFIATLCLEPKGQAWHLNYQVLLRQEPAVESAFAALIERSIAIYQDSVRDTGGLSKSEVAYRVVVSASKDCDLRPHLGWRKSFRAETAPTHITNYPTFRDIHFRLSRQLSETFISSSTVHGHYRQEWLRHVVDESSSELRPRPGKKFALSKLWLAPGEDVGERGDRTEASLERDRRGLIHFTSQDLLVRYIFRPQLDLDYLLPTVFDGVGRRFSAQPDNVTPSGCGAAVDLHKFANTHPETDGLPEVVTSPPDVGVDVLDAVDILGPPGLEHPPIGVSARGLTTQDGDESFLVLMQRKYDLTARTSRTTEE